MPNSANPTEKERARQVRREAIALARLPEVVALRDSGMLDEVLRLLTQKGFGRGSRNKRIRKWVQEVQSLLRETRRLWRQDITRTKKPSDAARASGLQRWCDANDRVSCSEIADDLLLRRRGIPTMSYEIVAKLEGIGVQTIKRAWNLRPRIRIPTWIKPRKK